MPRWSKSYFKQQTSLEKVFPHLSIVEMEQYKYLLYCKKHKQLFEQHYHHLISRENVKPNCPNCLQEFYDKCQLSKQAELDEYCIYDITVIDNAQTNFPIYLCNTHNEIFTTRHNGLIYYNKTPTCKQCRIESKKKSYLERKVMMALDELNVNYITEKYVKDFELFSGAMKGRRFDFYLKDHNLFIEADGRQHFPIKTSMYNYEREFPLLEDVEKNEYCIKYTKGLLRLSHWTIIENNIQQLSFIIKKYLNCNQIKYFGDYSFMI